MDINSKYFKYENTTWYVLSIFYSKQEWHLLLSHIRNFYLKYESLLNSLYICLSDRQGENIGIAITSEENNRELFSDTMKLYFEEFLRKKPSLLYSDSKREKIWMDYPVDSLVFNQFNIPYPLVRDQKYRKFVKLTSLLIIKLYDKECSSDENMYTILSFLNVKLLINTFENDLPHSKINENIEIFEYYKTYKFEDEENLILMNVWIEEVKSLIQQDSSKINIDLMMKIIFSFFNYNKEDRKKIAGLLNNWSRIYKNIN